MLVSMRLTDVPSDAPSNRAVTVPVARWPKTYVRIAPKLKLSRGMYI